ncbi:MAG: hypothetical protein HKN11_04445 [Rhizobiales bacterium]|nr:hypothetical protein [Hyphomicrobiales bacterium]
MTRRKPLLYRVLVLEDDFEAASKILGALSRIEPHLAPYDLDVTLLSTCRAVEELINDHPDSPFDIILMDRNAS